MPPLVATRRIRAWMSLPSTNRWSWSITIRRLLRTSCRISLRSHRKLNREVLRLTKLCRLISQQNKMSPHSLNPKQLLKKRLRIDRETLSVWRSSQSSCRIEVAGLQRVARRTHLTWFSMQPKSYPKRRQSIRNPLSIPMRGTVRVCWLKLRR